jgi:hypothetical protein
VRVVVRDTCNNQTINQKTKQLENINLTQRLQLLPVSSVAVIVDDPLHDGAQIHALQIAGIVRVSGRDLEIRSYRQMAMLLFVALQRGVYVLEGEGLHLFGGEIHAQLHQSVAVLRETALLDVLDATACRNTTGKCYILKRQNEITYPNANPR